jgi:hypothetical protein
MRDRVRLIRDLDYELHYATAIERLQIRYILFRARHRRWGKRIIKIAAIPLAAIFAWALTDNPWFIGTFTLLVWYYSLVAWRTNRV